jgi:hypothetical protein
MKRPRAVIQDANDRARAALLASSGKRDASIGALAWWDGNMGWRESAAKVQAACIAAGLDPASTLPAVPDYVVAFGRAVQAVSAAAREKDVILTDAAEGPEGERRVAIYHLERNGKVSGKDEGTVVCPKPKIVDGERADLAPYVERPDPQGLASEVVRRAKKVYHGMYTSDDVRTAIVQTIDRWHGMPCRVQPPKIVYWIPGASLDVLGKVADFASAVGWGSVEMFVGDSSNDRSRAAVASAVNNGLEAMLNEFSDQADKYIAGDPLRTKGATLQRLLEDGKALQDRWHLMKSVLGASIKAGDSKIGKIEARITSRLSEVTKARKDAKDERKEERNAERKEERKQSAKEERQSA